jgi:hypothetical protein
VHIFPRVRYRAGVDRIRDVHKVSEQRKHQFDELASLLGSGTTNILVQKLVRNLMYKKISVPSPRSRHISISTSGSVMKPRSSQS